MSGTADEQESRDVQEHQSQRDEEFDMGEEESGETEQLLRQHRGQQQQQDLRPLWAEEGPNGGNEEMKARLKDLVSSAHLMECVSEICPILGTDPHRGLPILMTDEAEADQQAIPDEQQQQQHVSIRRLQDVYGKNEFPLVPKRPSLLGMFLRQLTDLMQLILTITSLVALFVVQDVVASMTLGVVVVFNVAVGFLQEWKAERALHDLMTGGDGVWGSSSHRATVTRSGRTTMEDAVELVPGDLVTVEEGDMIPADMRIVTQWGDLEVMEALLTGESSPVHKTSDALVMEDDSGSESEGRSQDSRAEDIALGDRKNMLYMSTVVVKGRGNGIVVATGMHTQVGIIRDQLMQRPDEDEENESPGMSSSSNRQTELQKKLSHLGLVLVGVSVVLCSIVTAAGIFYGKNMYEMVTIGIALAVSVIPEGLVACTTAVMALGVQRMAKKKAIVRHMPAMETMGAVTVICTDKTGTLTTGVMRTQRLWTQKEQYLVSDSEESDWKGRIHRLQAQDELRNLSLKVPQSLENHSETASDSEYESEEDIFGKGTDIELPLLLQHRDKSDTTPSSSRKSRNVEEVLDLSWVDQDDTNQSWKRLPLPLSKMLLVMSLSNDATLQRSDDDPEHHMESLGDPTDVALALPGVYAGITKSTWTSDAGRDNCACTFAAEIPFNSKRMRMSATYRVIDWSLLPALCGVDDFAKNRPPRSAGSSAGGDSQDDLLIVCKGALESIMDVCTSIDSGNGNGLKFDDTCRRELEEHSEEFTKKGLRVLAMAYRVVSSNERGGQIMPQDMLDDHSIVERDMTFLGLTGIMDPPRPGVKDSIAVLRQAGIKVVMITGDHPNTAECIARKLGIIDDQRRIGKGIDPYFQNLEKAERQRIKRKRSERQRYYQRRRKSNRTTSPFPEMGNRHNEIRVVVRGKDIDRILSQRHIDDTGESDGAILARQLSPFPCVFARVSPENKVQIMDALRNRGDVCAMIGDGINDAPAMKRSNVGVAMGRTGTDIAREAASVVLADDNFCTIENAVREGRRTYDNILLFITYLLSANLGEIFVMLLSSLLDMSPPFSAIQILYANLIGDTPPALALGVEPEDPDVMHRMPRNPHSSVFNAAGWLFVTTQGFLQSLIALTAFSLARYVEGNTLAHARAFVWALLLCLQLAYAFQCRSISHSFFEKNPLGNRWMVAGCSLSLFFVVAGLYVPGLNKLMELQPLNLWDWAKVGIATSLHLAISELMKVGLRLRRVLVVRWGRRSRFYSDI